MNAAKYCPTAGTFVLIVALSSGILAQTKSPAPSIDLRRIPEQVVLYTLHRGSFETVGTTIAELIGAGVKKGAYPRGAICFVYLNDFETTPREHWLTEIRVPVGSEALAIAGTLGKFTDVKKLPSVEAAVAIKPEGEASPESIYRQLHAWMFEKGYMPAGGTSEVFLTNARTADYSQMKSEIRIPVRKMTP